MERLLRAIAPHPHASLKPQRYHVLRHLLPHAAGLGAGGANVAQARRSLAAAAEQLPESQRYRCLRALAILHWEWAVEEEQARGLSGEARRCYAFAGLVWRRLLSDEAFWTHFADDHAISAEHLAEARTRIAETILTHHLDQAKRCSLASDWLAGRFHVTCLANWEQPPPVLAGPPAAASKEHESVLAAEFAARASGLVNAWVSEFLGRANNRLSESLESLPDGISRNFPAALAVARPALEIIPDNRRLLIFHVKQANDYAYELAVADRFDEARPIIAAAVPHARRLAETYLRPGDSRHPDNEAVCLTFLLACQLSDDPGQSLTYLSERRRWGGRSDDAGQQDQEARHHFRAGKLAYTGGAFADGERHLRRAIQLDADEPVYREQLAILYLDWARALSERAGARLRNLSKSISSFLADARRGGQNLLQQPRQLHRQALEKIRLAREVAPPAKIAEVDAARAGLLSPLDWYWMTLRGLAASAMKEKRTQHYADFSLALESFPAPPDSPRMQEARPLRAALYHHQQDAAWEAGDLDGAIEFARRALECDPTHPVLKETLEQLKHIRATGGMQYWKRAQGGADHL